MSMRLIGTGRLTRDPELSHLPDGTLVCEIRIVADRMGRAGGTGYLDFAQYGPGAEAAARTLTKGWKVLLDGRLEHREWQTPDGTTRNAYRGIGHIEFLAAPRPPAADSPLAAVPDEDVPF